VLAAFHCHSHADAAALRLRRHVAPSVCASAALCQSKYADFKQNFLRLGDDAPNFDADSSLGKINFHEFIGQPEGTETGPRGQTEAVTSPLTAPVAD